MDRNNAVGILQVYVSSPALLLCPGVGYVCSTASSTEAYEIEASSREIPSLTLPFHGKERSTIVRHLSAGWDFGTNPIGLV